jgi:flagellar hook-length control protein FliK
MQNVSIQSGQAVSANSVNPAEVSALKKRNSKTEDSGTGAEFQGVLGQSLAPLAYQAPSPKAVTEDGSALAELEMLQSKATGANTDSVLTGPQSGQQMSGLGQNYDLNAALLSNPGSAKNPPVFERGGLALPQGFTSIQSEPQTLQQLMAASQSQNAAQNAAMSAAMNRAMGSLQNPGSNLGVAGIEEMSFEETPGLQSIGGLDSRNSLRNSGAGNLSGAEFLTALSTAQNGAQGGGMGGSGANGGQGQSQFGRQALKPGIQTMGGKGVATGAAFGEISKGTNKNDKAAKLSPQFSGEALLQTGFASRTNAMGTHGTVTGHVVSGAMAQGRLSSQSLGDIGSQIKNIGAQVPMLMVGGKPVQGLGGGEIRVRLKPENLGELHLKVVTQGNQVGLQIQASDENAKRIIEESMNSLKESLSTQNLSLAKVDVSVASSSQSSFGNPNQSHDSGQWNLGQQQDFGQSNWANGQGQGREGGEWSQSSRTSESENTRPMTGVWTGIGNGPRNTSVSSSGRLDVQA